MAFEKLLNNPVIQKYLRELAGPTGIPIAAAPPDDEVTDKEFVEELRLELNDVRRALFILYKSDLASYHHARDEDSSWFTYLQIFHYGNIPENLREEMYRLLDALEERLNCGHNHEFYLSGPTGIRFEFSEAVEHGFQCPEAGAQFEPMNNDDLVDAMKRHIEELRDELNVEVTGTS